MVGQFALPTSHGYKPRCSGDSTDTGGRIVVDETTTPDERVPINIQDEMRRSYMEYAMSVTIGRALPDV